MPEYDLFFAVDGEELAKPLDDAGFNTLKPIPILSRTDRITQANQTLQKEVVLNVQADEPLVSRYHILALTKAIHKKGADLATLASFLKQEDFTDPNQVKVVLDRSGFALMFSRSPIHMTVRRTGTLILFLINTLDSMGIERTSSKTLLKFLLEGWRL